MGVHLSKLQGTVVCYSPRVTENRAGLSDGKTTNVPANQHYLLGGEERSFPGEGRPVSEETWGRVAE